MNSRPMVEVCAGDGWSWLRRYQGLRPTFVCVLSFTETALIPGISAAGKTPQDRALTAAADATFLASGTSDRLSLPPLSAGISPAVISRAILQRLGVSCHLLSTGLPTELNVAHTTLPTVIARAVQTGNAMSIAEVESLVSAGYDWGLRLARSDRYLVVGECVVGGTTTAQAVLEALGYDVAGLMSSSHVRANHAQKQALIKQGLEHAKIRGSKVGSPLSTSVLSILAAVGDPMQTVVAGMLLAASCRGGVLLAGGAQMLAVYAIAQVLANQEKIDWHPAQVAVGTTRWVIEDGSADTVAIARQIEVSYLASQIDFSQSPYVQLRAYERGFVKEGMGAGGYAIAAHLYKGWNASQLRHATEAQLRLL